MRARPLACLLLASLAAAEDVVLLRGRADPRIEVVDVDGGVRQRVRSAAWVAALPTGGPALFPLSASEALCAWTGGTFTALSVLCATPDGVVEIGVSTLPAGWAVQGAADFDGDGRADLVLTGHDIVTQGGAVSVYKRKADGEIDPKGTIVAQGGAGQAPLPALAWLRARGEGAPRGEEPSAERLAAWWADLSGERPNPLARAVGAFVRAGAAAVPFLASKLPSEPAMDAARIRRLIADLDADEWETREQATQALTEIVDMAEPLLQEALAKSASVEARTRIEQVLDSRTPLRPQDAPPEDLLPIRVVGLLEAIGTEDAYAAIGRVAASSAPRSVRRFASEALGRR